MASLVLQAARRHQALSALTAKRAGREVLQVRRQGTRRVTTVLATHQIAQARESQAAVASMLNEQNLDSVPDAIVNALALTTPAASIDRMLEAIQNDGQLVRWAQSLVQSSGRVSEHLAIASRPQVRYVRQLSGPSCSRCAVLAGRVYRYSQGFLRHPRCDCIMVPTSGARGGRLLPDVAQLVSAGMVRSLSKADALSVADGTQLEDLVDVHAREAGLAEPGMDIRRPGQPIPETVLAAAASREQALDALERFGYLIAA